jgi:hypothetical protein
MMSECSRESRGAWVESTDPDAAFRAQFLKLLDCLQVEPACAIALAEASAGRPFESCTPVHLVPVLDDMLRLLYSQCSPVVTRPEARHA